MDAVNQVIPHSWPGLIPNRVGFTFGFRVTFSLTIPKRSPAELLYVAISGFPWIRPHVLKNAKRTEHVQLGLYEAWGLFTLKSGDFCHLGGGFKYFVCSSLLGEMIQFDYCIIFQMGWFNHQLVLIVGIVWGLPKSWELYHLERIDGMAQLPGIGLSWPRKLIHLLGVASHLLSLRCKWVK